MTPINVSFTLDDPRRLYEGTHPVFPLPVRQIQLARFASRQDALSGTSPTIITTFTLPNPAGPAPNPDLWIGPFRYGFYDTAQTPATWYAYRLVSQAFDYSPWSEPWSPSARGTVSLAEIVYAMPRYLGDLFRVVTASTTPGTIASTEFEQGGISDDFFHAWYVWPLTTFPNVTRVDGRVNATTLSVSPDNLPTSPGLELVLSPVINPRLFLSACQRALEDMIVEQVFLLPGATEVDAPMGVETPSDILNVYGVIGKNEHPLAYSIATTWPLSLTVPSGERFHYLKLRALSRADRVYGPPTNLGSEYQLPRAWLEAAVAYAAATILADQDPEDPFAAALVQRLAVRYTKEKGRYAPEPSRPLVPYSRDAFRPGPIARF